MRVSYKSRRLITTGLALVLAAFAFGAKPVQPKPSRSCVAAQLEITRN